MAPKKKAKPKGSATKAIQAQVEVVAPRGPGGQPTKYEPRFCEMLLKHAAEGGAFETFAAEIGVHFDTLYNWAKLFPEFSEAREIARAKCLRFYEQIARHHVMGIAPMPPEGARAVAPSGKLLEFMMRIHGKQAGFQEDGSNKGIAGNDPHQAGKDTTVNFQYLDSPAAKKEEES